MRTPFGFTNWNIIIGFLQSWFTWKIISWTLIPWGWITVNDGFLITCIFTAGSYLRVYILTHIKHYLHRKDYENDINIR